MYFVVSAYKLVLTHSIHVCWHSAHLWLPKIVIILICSTILLLVCTVNFLFSFCFQMVMHGDNGAKFAANKGSEMLSLVRVNAKHAKIY